MWTDYFPVLFANIKILLVRLYSYTEAKLKSAWISVRKSQEFISRILWGKENSNNFVASFQDNKCRRLVKQYFPILSAHELNCMDPKKPSNKNRNCKTKQARRMYNQ